MVKPLALFTGERAMALPNLGTAREQGFSDLDASTWFGLFVPSGTPASVIKRLREATLEAIDTPSVREQFAKTGTFAPPAEQRSTEFLKQYIESEIERNAALIRSAGVSSIE
jgi:tripartite-type tricarboxylate transporter receptor subunit TctC